MGEWERVREERGREGETEGGGERKKNRERKTNNRERDRDREKGIEKNLSVIWKDMIIIVQFVSANYNTSRCQ